MPPLDYKSPGEEDKKERLRRWENWLLWIEIGGAALGILVIAIVFGMGRGC